MNENTQQGRQNIQNLIRMTLAVGVGIIVGYTVVSFAIGIFAKGPVEVPFVQTQEATTTERFARSAPTEIRIPKINLVAEFEEPLGLNEDQTIEVPESYEKVGWYKNGATPGETGPATVLGHVDNYKGPAIFYNIKDLKEGDEIEIEREDGTTAVFVVTHSERYDQNNFPTETVYGMTDYPALRLITCTGVYNHGTLRYSHNLVVFAKLKEEA